MKTVFATFNFRSGDIAEGERLYLKNHVPLTLQLPNLRQYITGVIRPGPEPAPAHRAAFNYFDDAKALHWALHKSPQAKPLIKDGAAHLRVNHWLELDSDIIVPFTDRYPGLNCFVVAMEFELKLNEQDPEAAEQSYLDEHVAMVRDLPNLRHLMISKYQVIGMPRAAGLDNSIRLRNPLRMMMLVFNDFEQYRNAYESAIGQELKAREERTMTKVRVYNIDATVQL